MSYLETTTRILFSFLFPHHILYSTKGMNMKQKLIDKVLERILELESEEQLNQVGLDIYEIVEAAVEQKLSTMTEDQLLELL